MSGGFGEARLEARMYAITADCPCEGCEKHDYCAETSHECRTYIQWTQKGDGHSHRSRKATHLASDIRTASDRKIERIVRGMK